MSTLAGVKNRKRKKEVYYLLNSFFIKCLNFKEFSILNKEIIKIEIFMDA
jgi:hypothetical protein